MIIGRSSTSGSKRTRRDSLGHESKSARRRPSFCCASATGSVSGLVGSPSCEARFRKGGFPGVDAVKHRVPLAAVVVAA
jgi:hypothetical protein